MCEQHSSTAAFTAQLRTVGQPAQAQTSRAFVCSRGGLQVAVKGVVSLGWIVARLCCCRCLTTGLWCLKG